VKTPSNPSNNISKLRGESLGKDKNTGKDSKKKTINGYNK
jgi:hypothetical protein